MRESCIFCRIVDGDIPSKRVAENGMAIAVFDVNPQAPAHILVIPRAHVASLMDLNASDRTWLSIVELVQNVARQQKLDDGFRVVVNQGSDGGQTVPHLHVHVLGGRTMSWPPG